MDNTYILYRKLLYKELQSLFEELSSVKYAVVKGEALSQQIYGVPNCRNSGDIDILIDKKNVKLLEKQLRRLGFEQELPENSMEARRNRVMCLVYSHQIPSYHKEKFGFHFNVDINYDIFWGEYEGKRCPMDEFLNNVVDMKIYGVQIKALTIENAFIQLILHHYKEMNSLYHLSQHNTICTAMFKDIYDMILLNPKRLTVNAIHSLSVKYGVVELVYYMLYYTYCVFSDNRLEPYLAELKCFENKNIMDCYGLCEKERKQWLVPFEERLNYDDIWNLICDDMLDTDIKKIMLEKSVFG